MALALDVVDAAGVRAARSGADIAVAIGVGGAVATAVTGAADWSQTDGEARRVGVVHAASNIVATLLYAASMVMRTNGSRRGARLTAAAGFGASMAGAFLGGHLVFGHQVGVDHTATADAGKPKDFVVVLPEAELTKSPKRVLADGVAVVLVRDGAEIRALTETCPHLGGPLAEGTLEDGTIRCPWHGSRFDLATGAAVEGPTAFPARCYETRVRDGNIEVRARQRSEA
jgi:nitrite reductase/ring-hydroxylating ferredoxin subunit